MEHTAAKRGGVDIYGAYGEYQRIVRERKFRIAEKEDAIANLRSKLSATLEDTRQRKQKCESLALELKMEEARSLAETEKKLKLDKEAEEITNEYYENLESLEKANAVRLQQDEFEISRKMELENLERNYMKGFMKIPEVASLINAQNELKDLERHSQAVQEKLTEVKQNLLQMQHASYEDWNQFVGISVELAKNWKSQSLNEIARQKYEEEKKLQQIEKEKQEAQKRAYERRFSMLSHSTVRYSRVFPPQIPVRRYNLPQNPVPQQWRIPETHHSTAPDTPRPVASLTPRPVASLTPRPKALEMSMPTALVTPRPTEPEIPMPTEPETPMPTAPETPRLTELETPRPTASETPRTTEPEMPKAVAPQTPISLTPWKNPETPQLSAPQTPIPQNTESLVIPGGDFFLAPTPKTSSSCTGNAFATPTESPFSFFNFGGLQEQSSQSSEGGGFLNLFGNDQISDPMPFNFFGDNSSPPSSADASSPSLF